MKNSAQLPFLSRVSFLDTLFFTKHLSIMIKSGITLTSALDTLIAQTESAALKRVLTSILKNIENGHGLAESLEKHPKVFDVFYVSLIKVGEESGKLDENLDYLAEHLAKSYALRKKVKGALMYPAIVMIALCSIGFGISIFVLPKLVDLFSTLDVTLPLTTKILLFFADLMKNHGVLVVGGLVGVIVLIRFLLSLPGIKPLWHNAMLYLPVLGPFMKNAQMASISRNLGVMIKSGLSIREALEIQVHTTTNLTFKTYMKEIASSVERGREIGQELEAKKFKHFPLIAVRMIGVGEKTGKLDEIFIYLGSFFEDEVDNMAQNLSTILEPIVLLVVGLIVAFVALAIISPIYQLTGSID